MTDPSPFDRPRVSEGYPLEEPEKRAIADELARMRDESGQEQLSEEQGESND